MNSEIIKLEEESKKLNDKTFKEAFNISEKIKYLDLTDKIIIQSALRQAIALNDYNYKLNKLIDNYLNKYLN
tara:strand:+ start:178 stop:393 length:216 start_codon:yes stop_codon:yes gene_type:complete